MELTEQTKRRWLDSLGLAGSDPEFSEIICNFALGEAPSESRLDGKTRHLAILAAQGGCEPQLVSHAAGNMRLGNDGLTLIDAVSQCLPYMGYPRSLNALRCVDEAAK